MPGPRVHVIGTGGTIGTLGRHRLDLTEYGAFGQPILIDGLLARIPEAAQVAQVTHEQPFIEDYKTLAMGPDQWVALAQRCNELFAGDGDLSGVVITHGTNLLEETAFFLHLTVRDERPVVFTGSQRPPTGISTDADVNLLDAIRVAASPAARGKGALTAFNNEINSVREMAKTNTFRLETFQSPQLGLLGYADSDGKVVFYRTPTRRHTADSEFDVAGIQQLPQVDIVYVYGGVDGRLMEALVERGARGIVVAGSGAGGMPPAMAAVAREVAGKGVPVVLSSRTGSGRVALTQKSAESGFVVADNLSPQKARVLLMLGLTKTKAQAELQRMFDTY
ncbi:MAG: asparaginase [SAR202 cluster bacterium]|nr:asparaginase [SAR202 cluster bacterium]